MYVIDEFGEFSIQKQFKNYLAHKHKRYRVVKGSRFWLKDYMNISGIQGEVKEKQNKALLPHHGSY
jgi:hypothetical protein